MRGVVVGVVVSLLLAGPAAIAQTPGTACPDVWALDSAYAQSGFVHLETGQVRFLRTVYMASDCSWVQPAIHVQDGTAAWLVGEDPTHGVATQVRWVDLEKPGQHSAPVEQALLRHVPSETPWSNEQPAYVLGASRDGPVLLSWDPVSGEVRATRFLASGEAVELPVPPHPMPGALIRPMALAMPRAVFLDRDGWSVLDLDAAAWTTTGIPAGEVLPWAADQTEVTAAFPGGFLVHARERGASRTYLVAWDLDTQDVSGRKWVAGPDAWGTTHVIGDRGGLYRIPSGGPAELAVFQPRGHEAIGGADGPWVRLAIHGGAAHGSHGPLVHVPAALPQEPHARLSAQDERSAAGMAATLGALLVTLVVADMAVAFWPRRK